MKTSVRGGCAALVLGVMACDDGVSTTGSGGSSSTTTTTTTATTSTTSAGGAGACNGTQSDDPQFAQAMEALRAMLPENGTAGGAISVVKDGKVVGIGVHGSKRDGVCEPITEDTLFGLPYFSVALTSIAALDAVEDGKLTLHSSIADVIGPLSVEHGAQYSNDITLHHLLTSTSTYTSAADAQPQQSTCTSLVSAFANPVDAIVEAAPGSICDPDDRANAELTALALQVADGKPYPEVMAARVLAPLGLEGTFDLSEVEARDHSRGYLPNGGGEATPFDCPNHYASYGYYGSIRDVAKLGVYLTAGGPPLESASFATMLSEQAPAFWKSDYSTYVTSGWKESAIGEDVQGKFGGVSAGFNGGFLLFPERGLAIGVVFNMDTFATAVLALQIAKIYGVDPGVDAWYLGDTYTPDAASLPSLTGTYVDPVGFEGSGSRTMVVYQPDAATIAGTLSDAAGNSMSIAFAGNVCEDNFLVNGNVLARFWRDAADVPYALQIQGYRGPPFFRVP